MEKQIEIYASGNEAAARAVQQLGYDLMGYYPITPSTQIAEMLDLEKSKGNLDMVMIPAEGEHSAAGICYGASVGGGRVFNATSANGLLYAIEQLPVQSGTRYPMVLNVACRTVSGPLSIKCDHSDIMYMLHCGWPILFAANVQQVYDFNIIALRLAEELQLPVAVAYDGFFVSHQKHRCSCFEEPRVVQDFVGEKKEYFSLLDLEHPISVGSYMNEKDIMTNRYQLHDAMEYARKVLPMLFKEYASMSGRHYGMVEGYGTEDADVLLVLLGSSYETAAEAVDRLRMQGVRAGVVTLHALRPFPAKELVEMCSQARVILVADRQDSYGGGGGSLSTEVRAAMQRYGSGVRIRNLVYGLGGQDFTPEDALEMFTLAVEESPEEQENSCARSVMSMSDDLGYFHVDASVAQAADADMEHMFFRPLTKEKTKLEGAPTINGTTQMPKRIAPGHGACAGCGIPVNLNLLLRAIEHPVVLLFQTGCGMIVNSGYPITSFRVPYLHNLFQNGAATLSGLLEMCKRRQDKGELPQGDILFIMVSGDGGLDIGMGSALAAALRNHNLLLFEYDNGGYMNTGYQLSYSTPKGAKSATSHVGPSQYGKTFFHKDMPQLMAATGMPYVATVAESNPMDFMKKAVKAADAALHKGTAYLKALSACPLNWNDNPMKDREVIDTAVKCCYFPLYEVDQGKTTITYDPVKMNQKVPVEDFLGKMGRTKHLLKEEYAPVVKQLQEEIDRRYEVLLAKAQHPLL